jgi:hypothetical protein
MQKPFKGVALPKTADLIKAVAETRQNREATLDLCKILLKLARHKFETELRKDHDFFLMEQHKDQIVHKMVDVSMKVCETIALNRDVYAAATFGMKNAFLMYTKFDIKR